MRFFSLKYMVIYKDLFWKICKQKIFREGHVYFWRAKNSEKENLKGSMTKSLPSASAEKNQQLWYVRGYVVVLHFLRARTAKIHLNIEAFRFSRSKLSPLHENECQSLQNFVKKKNWNKSSTNFGYEYTKILVV